MIDEEILRARAREVLRTGKLPNARPERIWGGPGIGQRCALCDEPIERNQSELELQYPDPRKGKPVPGDTATSGGKSREPTHHIHVRCFAVWESERKNGQSLSGCSKEGIMKAHECDTANGAV
jgi:hypothetical protein